MKKRKYTKIQVLEPKIVSMQEAGKTHREIAKHFGLERSQVKKCSERRRVLIDDFFHFYNRERIQLKNGVAPLSLRHSA